MAIAFTTVFTDLGKVLAAFANINQFGGVQAPSTASHWGSSGPLIKVQSAMISDVLTRLEGSGLTDLIAYQNWQSTVQGIDTSLQSQKSVLAALAQQIIIKRVNNDVPQQSPTDFTQAMTEFIRQMQSQTESIKSCTISSTPSAGAGNTGNATVYASLIDRNGLALDYVRAETLILKCTQDANHGGTAGSETVNVTSPSAAGQYSYLWPGGSGLSSNLTVVDPTQGNGSGSNLLSGSASGLTTFGAFKSWTGSVPDGWVVDVDGGNISDGTSDNYSGTAHCLKFAGNTGGTNLNTSVYQNFANGSITGGSTTTITPDTVYHFYMQIKADVVPAAGAISVSLTDDSGTVINNNAGTANTIVSTVSGFGGTTYQTVTGTFQTPTVMPTSGKVRIRIKATTKITSGSNVFIDFVTLTAPSEQGNRYGGLYAGGPYMSIFRGSVDLVNFVSPTIGDYWTVAIANNYATSSPTPLSFGNLFDQMFGLSALGLICPTSGSPSQAATLIA